MGKKVILKKKHISLLSRQNISDYFRIFQNISENFRIFAGWALTGTLEALPLFLLMETECKPI